MRFLGEIKNLIKSTGVTHFPMGLKELKQIIENSGWEIYSYSNAEEIIDNYNLREMTKKNDSFVARVGDRIVIFYDDNISQLDFPHILGHEIGHIVLGHLDSSKDIYSKERDCEIFSKELLNFSSRYFVVPAIVYSMIGICILVAIVVGLVKSKNSNEIIIHSSNNSYDSSSDYYSSTDEQITNEPFIISSSESSTTEIYPTGEYQTDENNATIVYITTAGKKYHLEGCQYIKDKNNLIEIFIDEAEAAGYEPCKVCFGQ